MRFPEQRHSFETLVGTGPEAARFDAAFFRYLEQNAAPGEEGPMMIRSLPEGAFERKTVVLWSQTAAAEFVRLWRGCSPE